MWVYLASLAVAGAIGLMVGLELGFRHGVQRASKMYREQRDAHIEHMRQVYEHRHAELERRHEHAPPSSVVAPIRLATPADGESQVSGAVERKRERTGREGP